MQFLPPDAAPAVRPFTDTDAAAWNEFVLAQPNGTFFHRCEWREVLQRAFGHETHFLLAESGGQLRGILPLAELKSRLFGHSLVSTPFCVYGGILAADEPARRALEARACELAQELGVDYLEMRNRRRQHPDWPVKDMYVTFRRIIHAESDQNLMSIPQRRRTMVRKGFNSGLQSRVDDGVDRAYAMYSESLRNLGTPVFSKRYLEILKDVFGEDCECLSVLHEGQPVASVLSFYFRDEVLPYYGGGTMAARPVAGNDFMYWEVMDRARRRGLRIFDYGRSKRGTGAYDFKKLWGFEPETLYYEYFLVRAKEVPNLSPTNPKYERLINLWRKLPTGLTRLVGPPIAKYLG